MYGTAHCRLAAACLATCNWLPLTSHSIVGALRANPYALLRKHPGFQANAKDGDMLSVRGSSL